MVGNLYSPIKAVRQLRDQLSSDKRKLGFLFGAGTSMSIGIPGIEGIMQAIKEKINADYDAVFTAFKDAIGTNNIEELLNRLRTLRDFIKDDEKQEIYSIRGRKEAQLLDIEICKAIVKVVSTVENNSIEPHDNFATWLSQNHLRRYSPVEIFTTNYDLFFEKAFEEKKIPYFDGFVGSINSFLVPECIEAENIKNDPDNYIPHSWVRLWKLHGSINWYLTKKEEINRIIRCSNREIKNGEELMIYPSRQKYDESRRLPFLVFQDRFRKFLSNGEVLLIINGYSFGDEHINEMLFQALRANKRLAIIALIYGDINFSGKRATNAKLTSYGKDYPNLSILGPDNATIGGRTANWNLEEDNLSTSDFWNSEHNCFNLGDYKNFSNFLYSNFEPHLHLPIENSSLS